MKSHRLSFEPDKARLRAQSLPRLLHLPERLNYDHVFMFQTKKPPGDRSGDLRCLTLGQACTVEELNVPGEPGGRGALTDRGGIRGESDLRCLTLGQACTVEEFNVPGEPGAGEH